MSSSAYLLCLTVLSTATFVHVSPVPIGKEDICAALKNVEQSSCDKLETSFKAGNCSEAEECVEKEKLEECFHGLIFNGTKYTADNECLQYYCNCFEGTSLTQEIFESDNSTMDSANATMIVTPAVDQDESSSTAAETIPEKSDTPNIDMSATNSTERSSEKSDMLNIDVSESNNSTELEFEEMDMNNTHSLTNMTSGKFGQYIRTQEPQTGNPGDSDTLNHRSGSRRPDNTPLIVQETSTRNIYDTDDTDKKNSKDHQDDHHHHEESTGHSSKATSPSNVYIPVLFLALVTSSFVFN